jgi:hypothetical protein
MNGYRRISFLEMDLHLRHLGRIEAEYLMDGRRVLRLAEIVEHHLEWRLDPTIENGDRQESADVKGR